MEEEVIALLSSCTVGSVHELKVLTLCMCRRIEVPAQLVGVLFYHVGQENQTQVVKQLIRLLLAFLPQMSQSVLDQRIQKKNKK